MCDASSKQDDGDVGAPALFWGSLFRWSLWSSLVVYVDFAFCQHSQDKDVFPKNVTTMNKNNLKCNFEKLKLCFNISKKSTVVHFCNIS